MYDKVFKKLCAINFIYTISLKAWVEFAELVDKKAF